MPTVVKVLIIAAAILVAALYIVGLTLGSKSEGKSEITQAVAENRELRDSLAAKDERINELEAEVKNLKGDVERLKAEIASMPTLPPEAPAEVPAAVQESPRDMN